MPASYVDPNAPVEPVSAPQPRFWAFMAALRNEAPRMDKPYQIECSVMSHNVSLTIWADKDSAFSLTQEIAVQLIERDAMPVEDLAKLVCSDLLADMRCQNRPLGLDDD
jgi:hypothetical protein